MLEGEQHRGYLRQVRFATKLSKHKIHVQNHKDPAYRAEFARQLTEKLLIVQEARQSESALQQSLQTISSNPKKSKEVRCDST